MSLDVSSAQAVLKTTYADGIVDIDYSKSKTLAMIKKNKGSLVSGPFGGQFVVPTQIGNPQAGGAGYSTAYGQASSEATKYSQWQITPKTFWHFADVNGDILRRGAGAGSFINAATSEIENAKEAMRRIFEIMLFKGGFGDLFQLSASAVVSSASGVALAQPWMARFVERGMSIVFANSEGASVLKGTTPVKVTGRHAAAGTVDFAFAPNTAGTLAAASDFGFRVSDRDNSATPVRQVITGIKAWLPPAAPSATLFNGVDRTVDDRLGGLRLDASLSGSPEEAFMDAGTLVTAEGGQISHFVMGPSTFNRLAKSMQNHVEYAEIQTDMGIGIPGFRLRGQDAIMYYDSACEEGVSYGFNIDEIEIRYAGPDLMYLEQQDGLTMREVGGSDLWRARLVTCSDLILPAPGHAIGISNL